MNPAPVPIPAPATEIWPSTKRCPPSMKRLIRSARAPRATRPATPTAIPVTVKRYPLGQEARQASARAAGGSPREPRLHRAALTPPPGPGAMGLEEHEREAQPEAERPPEEGPAREDRGHRVPPAGTRTADG